MRAINEPKSGFGQKLKNAIKVVFLAFLSCWFVNYITIIVALVSGHIDLSETIALNTVSEIYAPFFSYVLSGSVAFLALTDWRTWKVVNYKHLCLFIAFIAIEALVIYAFISHWVSANLGIKSLEVSFTPWSVSVKVVK
jgi:hypothetical protein